MKKKLNLVKIGGKDYEFKRKTGLGRVVLITKHPKDPERVLVFRKIERGLDPRANQIWVNEGSLIKNKIIEEKWQGRITYELNKGADLCRVFDFEVPQHLRRKTIGSVLRELVLKDAKEADLKYALFRIHEGFGKFYRERGFKKGRELDEESIRYLKRMRLWAGKPRFFGKVAELGVKPSNIKLKILWAKSRKPRVRR